MNLSKENRNLFLTARQAADLINVSLSTLKKLIHCGKLSTVTTPGGHHRILRADILRLAGSPIDFVDKEDHEREKDELLFEITEDFMSVIESRQRYCKRHSFNVSSLCRRLCETLRLSVEDTRNCRLAAFLHDVGKCNVPRQILNKPGKLTASEYSRIKKHCQIGYELIKDFKPFAAAAQIIRQHHERFDGSGYPEGRKGRQISLSARIITLADSFDAMTSTTSYHDPLTVDQAIEELKRCTAKQFDPEVVDAFFKATQKTL